MMNRIFWEMHEERDHRFAGRRRPEDGTPGWPDRGRGGHGHGPWHGFGPHGMGGSRRGMDGFGPGFGEARGRMFDAGDIRLVVLRLLADRPSYGYQLIKTMEQTMAGGYTPSAGVIYPTLTQLEEEGLTASTLENNKKVYSLTPAGTEYLEANKLQIGELFERLERTGRSFERGRSPEMMKAFLNLRGAVMARVSRENVKPELTEKIIEAINAAARAIDEL